VQLNIEHRSSERDGSRATAAPSNVVVLTRSAFICVVIAAGCGRIGFDAVEGGGDDEGLPGDMNVTSANDTCADAEDIDLSSGSATFTLTTQGAASDYPYGSCCDDPGLTDVVIRLRSPTTTTVRISCPSNDGSYYGFASGTSPVNGVCPTGGPTNCSSSTCGLASQTRGNILDGHLFVVCRDPSNGPVTLRLDNE
jgi:hypothetical protein